MQKIFTINQGESIDLGNGITLQISAPQQTKSHKTRRKAHRGIPTIILAVGILCCTVCAAAFTIDNEESVPETPVIPVHTVKDVETVNPETIEVFETFTIEETLVQYSAPPVKAQVTEMETLSVVEEPEMTYVGSCRITAYCACAECCGEWAYNRPTDEFGNEIVKGAYGLELTELLSVAGKWPVGTKLVIPAIREEPFVVEDKTAKWIQREYGGMTVDIYCGTDHNEAWDYAANLPAEWMDVYIIEE